MKKKKVYLIAVIGILAFYCLSMFTSFTSAKSDIGEQFMTDYQRTEEKIFGANVDVDEYIENQFSFLNDNYPTLISIYDLEGNLVRQSGSYIKFFNYEELEEKYVYVDEYLDSSSRRTLAMFENDKDYYDMELFVYTIQDDEIIPIRMKMVDTNYYNINFDVKDKLIQNSEVKYYYTQPDAYKFVDIDEESIDRKIYDKMRKEHDAFSKEYKENLERFAYGGGSYFGAESAYFKGVVYISGEKYYIHLTSEIRPVLYTLKSDRFWYSVETQTFYISILGIVLLIAVNKLYNKNKRMEESKQAFTSAAAHELKTPLAVIQNQCECVIENIAPEKNSEYISSIYEESLRMNRLVATLLQYNRLASASKIDKEKCSLSEIISNEAEKYKSFAKARNIEINTEICDNATVVCNSELIALVADNFLSNAVKHSKDNSTVIVKVKKVKNRYKVSVYNKGEEIKPEYQKNLWDVFYREDKARNSSDNSTGMGLAICKQILELHKYKYGFEHIAGGVEFYFITD